jgi:lactate permease
MFHQLLTPVGGSLLLSFLVAAIPIVIVLVMLGLLQRPAYQAALAGLIAGLIVAVSVWQMPVGLALNSTAAGVAFALWPIMWIVFAALILYNTAVLSGRFDAFRRWVLAHLPNDKRIVLIVIGYGFGSLLEGVSGFGAPVAITASLLIMLGFKSLDAVV